MLGFTRSEYGNHIMFTVGNEQVGVRVTRGRIGKYGRWQRFTPDIFLLWNNRRVL